MLGATIKIMFARDLCTPEEKYLNYAADWEIYLVSVINDKTCKKQF